MVVSPGEKMAHAQKMTNTFHLNVPWAGHVMPRSGAVALLALCLSSARRFSWSSFVIDKFGYFSSLAAYACSVRRTSHLVATIRLSEEQS